MIPKTTLIFHAGHGKTGSSYLQSCLALNKELLSDYNIIYSGLNELQISKASSGDVSSGNGVDIYKLIIEKNINKLSEKLKADLASSQKKNIPKILLYSYEGLWQSLLNEEQVNDFIKASNNAGIDQIIIKFYTRNILEHFQSAYIQYFTRPDSVQNFSIYTQYEFAESYNIPSKCLKLARILNNISSVIFLPTNYSKCKDIHEDFFDSILKYTHINSPEILSIIKKPQSRIVNRTLNSAEIQLAVSLIKEGHNPKRLNDMLTNRLSKIKADKFCISKEVYTKLYEKSAHDITTYNSLMLQNNSSLYEEMQRPEEYEGAEEDINFYFKKSQLDIIAKYISKIS